MSMSSLNTKLSELDKLESDIAGCMQTASKCLSEFAKDKVVHRQADSHAQEFLAKIRTVENGILSQINYLNQVGVGAPHEGAAYLATRERQAANDRTNCLHDKLTTAQKRVREREEQTNVEESPSKPTQSTAPAVEQTETSGNSSNTDAEMLSE